MEDKVDPILKSDFEFENSEVNVVSTRDSPEIKLGGVKIGPFEEGKEYRVRFWIARELYRAGLARIKDNELLDSVKLYKIHWTERVQPVRKISPLPNHFYPLLRWYLTELRSEVRRNPERLSEYGKAKKLSGDILSCRLRKIVVLASSPEKVTSIISNLTYEERWLYERLYEMIDGWRKKILSLEGSE